MLAVAIYALPCSTKALLGIPCPGCGLTRATGAMLRLDGAGVLRFHPLAPVVAPLLGLMLWKALADAFRSPLGAVPNWILERLPKAFWWTLLAAMLLLWMYRLGTGSHPDPLDLGSGVITGLIWG